MGKPVISRAEFEAACARGSRYCGEVEDYGRTSWIPQLVFRPRPVSCPNSVHVQYNERFPATIHILVVDKPNLVEDKIKQDVDVFLKTQELANERERIKKDLIDKAHSYYESQILDLVAKTKDKGMEATFALEKQKAIIKGELHRFIDDVKMEKLQAERVPLAVISSSEYKRYLNVIGNTSPYSSSQGEIKQSPSEYEKYVRERAAQDPFATQMAMQPAIQGIAVGALGGMAVGYMAEGMFVKFSAEYSIYKGVGSFVGQSAASGINEVNYAGVLADALAPPLMGGIVGSAIEFKVPTSDRGMLRVVGYNKSMCEFGIDASTSYIFNKAGGAAIDKFQPLLKTSGERVFYNITLNNWLNYGNYESAKRLKDK